MDAFAHCRFMAFQKILSNVHTVTSRGKSVIGYVFVYLNSLNHLKIDKPLWYWNILLTTRAVNLSSNWFDRYPYDHQLNALVRNWPQMAEIDQHEHSTYYN